MDYIALGKKIRNERIKAHLTQAELAEKVDVSSAYIGQIERGEKKFSIETFVKIGLILNVSFDYLLRESNYGNTNSLISEITYLMENRGPHDIDMAVDILKAIFGRIDKGNNL